MYKIIIAILLSFFVIGCGDDTSPSGALLSVVNEKKITSQEDVAETISDYYLRTKRNISKENCSELSTDSDNVMDKSIIELSKKHCGNENAFKQEMNSVLTKINTDKSMSISMKDIDGTQGFIDAGFDNEATKIFLSANIAVNDAVDMVNANILYEKDILKFVALGVTSFDEMKAWATVKGRYFRISDIERWMKAGVTNAKEYKEWYDMDLYPKAVESWKSIGFKNPEDLKPWRDAGISRDKPEYIAEFKKLNINNPAEYKVWTSVGVFTPNSIKALNETKVNPADFKKYNLIGLSPNTIQDFTKNKIPLSNMKEYIEAFNNINNLDEFLKTTNVDVSNALSYLKSTGLKKAYNLKHWFAEGFTDPKEINTWHSNNYNAKNARIVVNLGFKNNSEVMAYIKKNNYNFRDFVYVYSSIDASQRNLKTIDEWFKLFNNRKYYPLTNFSTLKTASKEAYLTPDDIKIMVSNKYSIDKRTLGNIRNWYGSRSKNAEFCKKRKVEFIGYVSKGANNMTAVRKMEKESIN